MKSENQSFFSERQRKLVAAGLVAGALFVFVFVCIYAAKGLGWFLNTFSGVIWPLALAGILAGILGPLVNFLQKKAKFPRALAIVTIFILFFGAVGMALFFLIPTLINEATDFFRNLPGFFNQLQVYIKEQWPVVTQKIGFLEMLRSGTGVKLELSPEEMQAYQQTLGEEQMSQIFNKVKDYLISLPLDTRSIIESVKGFLMGTGSALLHTILVFIYLFFFLFLTPNVANMVRDDMTYVSESIREDIHFVIEQFMAIILAFFRGQLIICLLSGILMAIGFSIVGVKYSLILGIVFGMLNIVPCLGYIVGALSVFILGFFQPDGSLHIALLGLLTIGVTLAIDSKGMTPVIIGRSVGLHPLIIIISIFFWSTVINGVFGLLVAVPLTATIVVIWRVLKLHYFPRYSVAPKPIPHSEKETSESAAN